VGQGDLEYFEMMKNLLKGTMVCCDGRYYIMSAILCALCEHLITLYFILFPLKPDFNSIDTCNMNDK